MVALAVRGDGSEGNDGEPISEAFASGEEDSAGQPGDDLDERDPTPALGRTSANSERNRRKTCVSPKRVIEFISPSVLTHTGEIQWLSSRSCVKSAKIAGGLAGW